METEIAGRCNPELLSCITPEKLQFALPFVVLVLLALGIRGLIRHENRKHSGLLPKRGTAPSEGQNVNFVNMRTSRGRDNLIVTRHTKDPQKHARAMMPANARKKD